MFVNVHIVLFTALSSTHGFRRFLLDVGVRQGYYNHIITFAVRT